MIVEKKNHIRVSLAFTLWSHCAPDAKNEQSFTLSTSGLRSCDDLIHPTKLVNCGMVKSLTSSRESRTRSESIFWAAGRKFGGLDCGIGVSSYSNRMSVFRVKIGKTGFDVWTSSFTNSKL